MSFIFTLLIWLLLYFLESKKGIWISDSPVSQVIMCWIYFMNAFVMVKRGQTRELIFRPTQGLIRDLNPGVYFFPFLWWWGEVEQDYQPQKTSFVHIDTRQVFRKRELVGRWGWFEDISREFIVPFILRRSLWAIVICFIIAYFVGTYSVKLKYKYFADYFPKREVSVRYSPKQNVAANTTTSPAYSSNSTNNSYSSSSNSTTTTSVQNSYSDNSVQEVQQSQKEVWPPPESYNSAHAWDNLQLDDNYTAVANLNRGVNYVEEEGFFVSSSRSKNYYPHVYVDGFSESNDFFCKFFTVHINRLTFKNGEAWNNINMDLCSYIETVKNQSKVGEGQYKSIKITLKDEFVGKYKWHLVSAGFGNENSNFRLFLGDQSTSSNAEAKRKSDIEQNKANETQKRQQEAREAEQRYDYNEQTRIMRASIRFIPHTILSGYNINTVSQYLLKGYKISYDRNSDGSFIVLNDFNSVIQEEECFYFTFACRGFLYHSDNRKRFDGAMSRSLENDANISTNLPDYVYVINGRKFNFDGSKY